MELLMITIPVILFFSLLLYVLVQGVFRLSYGLKAKQKKVVIEGVVVLTLFSFSIVSMFYLVAHLWQKHDLQF